MKHPDPKQHLQISLAKSGIRILAGMVLILGNPALCGGLIIAAEILGVWEELV
jgi:hypothetical protein